MSELDRMLNRAKGEATGEPMSSPDLSRRADTYFHDIRDEMERALHNSRVAPSFKERLTSLVDFVRYGLEMLPEEEEEFKEQVGKLMEDKLKLPEIRLIPRFTESVPTYDIQTNLRTGYDTHCHVSDLHFVYTKLEEEIYQESLAQLGEVRSMVVRKLMEYKILDFERPYQGGIRVPTRARPRKMSSYQRFGREVEEVEDAE